MKIVAVLGSPRLNGNSAFLAERFLEAARNLGAETQSFALNTLAYRGCQACLACKKGSEICVLKDELTEVLEAIKNSDILVLASPVYYGDVTGQMKLFLDRTYCYLAPDYINNPNRSRLSPGKSMVFVQTQGLPDETVFADIFPRYSQMMEFNGIKKSYCIRGCGLSKKDDATGREDLLKRAENLAYQLVCGSAQE